MSENENRGVEKLLLVILFFITITQFSTWGYQSVKYILGRIFDVEVLSTPVDTVIGLVAMIASIVVFAASAMWWKNNTKAKEIFFVGAFLFVLKNVLDIINQVVLFGLKYEGVTKTVSGIEGLAISIGNEFFQLAFWIFIAFYFRYKISIFSRVDKISLSEEPVEELGKQVFTGENLK